MNYICTSCGNKFEHEDGALRCPLCLRKNGILPWEEDQKSSLRKRIIIISGICIGLLVLVGASFAYFTLKKPAKAVKNTQKVSEKTSLLPDWKKIEKASGFRIGPENPDPFSCGENCKKLVVSTDNPTKLRELISSSAQGKVDGTLKGSLRSVEELAKAVISKEKISATSLEWNVLAWVVLNQTKKFKASIIPVKPGKIIGEKSCIGSFAVIVSENTKDSQPVTLDVTGIPPMEHSIETPLSPESVVARYLAMRTLRKFSPWSNEWDIFHPENIMAPRGSEKEALESLKSLMQAEKIDSNPQVQCAFVWHGLVFRMLSNVKKYTSLMKSGTNSPGALSMDIVGRIIRSDYGEKTDLKLLKGFEASAVMYAATTGQKVDESFLDTLIDTRRPESIFPVIAYHLRQQTPDSYKKALTLLNAWFPEKKRWVVEYLFTIYINTGELSQAEELITFVRKQDPSSSLAAYFEKVIQEKKEVQKTKNKPTADPKLKN
ncbi:hypothetical protein KKF34_06025 [Myxococcota bacterium]|nr:hypothetical protein [Myxococcota bacterium]MBU1381741.1 hypothetical protein [Myxococcota bacterium]MBU1496419.1 hypothetical protein [Myxococcota bacterium]